MSDAPDPNSRFQLIVPASVLDEIKQLASTERRSVSNMIVVLVLEALKARKKKLEKEGNSRPVVRAAA